MDYCDPIFADSPSLWREEGPREEMALVGPNTHPHNCRKNLARMMLMMRARAAGLEGAGFVISAAGILLQLKGPDR